MLERRTKPPLTIRLCGPRGFCAGVDRAIQIVVLALKKYGAPVYVRHEIVHNRYVVEGLQKLGAVFIEELHEIPDEHHQSPVVFSAHGVPKSVPAAAKKRNMIAIDATCPLVSKVHFEAEAYARRGHQIIFIGHAGHTEVIGTMGQLPDGEILLVETKDDVERLQVRDAGKLSYLTQTTLSVDDTAGIIDALRKKFPAVSAPKKEDICYATTNRQAAVKDIAPRVDALAVVGSRNSSNSNRLVEVAKAYGCARSFLIDDAGGMDWESLKDIATLGLTAGASAPESLVQGVIDAARNHFDVTVEPVVLAQEDVVFNIPRLLTG